MQLQTIRSGAAMDVALDRHNRIADHEVNGVFFGRMMEVRNLHGKGEMSLWSEKPFLFGTDDWRRVRKVEGDPELEQLGDSILVRRVPARCQLFVSAEYFVMCDEDARCPEMERLRDWRPAKTPEAKPHSDVLVIP